MVDTRKGEDNGPRQEGVSNHGESTTIQPRVQGRGGSFGPEPGRVDQASGQGTGGVALDFAVLAESPTFLTIPAEIVVSSGISTPFGELSQTQGQVTHVLLTRAPLYLPSEEDFRVRLACVKRAANVRSEPGSNSPIQN